MNQVLRPVFFSGRKTSEFYGFFIVAGYFIKIKNEGKAMINTQTGSQRKGIHQNTGWRKVYTLFTILQT